MSSGALKIRALLAEAPSLGRASDLSPARLPVIPAFEEVLPHGGLRLGTTVGVTGVGATSLALALVARASHDSWTAAVGLPTLGLHAAAELGVELNRLVVVPDPGDRWDTILASLIDAFDIVLAHPPPTRQARHARRFGARVREQDAVLVVIGRWPESDLSIEGMSSTWHGIGRGCGHLRARELTVTIAGRGAASHLRRAALWLPDSDGDVSVARDATVVPIRMRRPLVRRKG